MKQRDTAIDIAKGIGILLMVLGHCAGLPHLVRNFIFSFHMPLFFILSGYFYKPKDMKSIFISGNRHLVRPYLITSIFCILFCLASGDLDLAKSKAIGILMSNGGWPSEKYGSHLPFIGPIWFLLALYWCKIFYAWLKRKTERTLLISLLISTAALIIGKYIVNLPLGILTGFCAVVFYAMGDYWKNRMTSPFNLYYLIIGLPVWAYCIRFAHLELATFDCSLYPVSMLAAFIGTYSTYFIAQKMPSLLQPILVWLGQNTLLILCYHTISYFLILNLLHHVFEPNGIILPVIAKSIIRFTISFLLPYIHTVIAKRISKN